jgi:hypothetical protein
MAPEIRVVRNVPVRAAGGNDRGHPLKTHRPAKGGDRRDSRARDDNDLRQRHVIIADDSAVGGGLAQRPEARERASALAELPCMGAT